MDKLYDEEVKLVSFYTQIQNTSVDLFCSAEANKFAKTLFRAWSRKPVEETDME